VTSPQGEIAQKPLLAPEWPGYDPGAIIYPTWLIEELIPERSTCCLYGAPNTGKSFLVLDMALAIATGRPWLGIPTRIQVGEIKERGKVVYILAENPEGLNRRITAWVDHNGINRLDAQKALDGHFYIPRIINSLMLNRPEVLDALIEEIKEHCPDVALIVFDPLVSYMEGDENSARDTQALIHALRRLVESFSKSHCSGLIIHHTGKDPTKPERGSSALRGGIDTLLVLTQTRLSVEKQRDAQKRSAIPIKLNPFHETLADGSKRDLGMIVELGITAPQPATPVLYFKDKSIDSPGADPIHATSRPPVGKVPVRVQKAKNNLEIVIEAVTRLTADAPDKSVSAAKILTDVTGRFSGKQATFYAFMKEHASEDGSTPLRRLADGKYALSQPDSTSAADQVTSTEEHKP